MPTESAPPADVRGAEYLLRTDVANSDRGSGMMPPSDTSSSGSDQRRREAGRQQRQQPTCVAPAEALQAALAHRSLYKLWFTDALQPEMQLGSDSRRAVGAARRLVDLDDQVTELDVGDHSGGRVGLPVPPREQG